MNLQEGGKGWCGETSTQRARAPECMLAAGAKRAIDRAGK